jgi:hypothetical protein
MIIPDSYFNIVQQHKLDLELKKSQVTIKHGTQKIKKYLRTESCENKPKVTKLKLKPQLYSQPNKDAH